MDSMYPLLSEVPRTVVQRPAGTGRYGSEFYPPWAFDNPRPGQSTVGLYGRQPVSLPDAEMIHLLGSVDPRSGHAVDPWFRYLKESMTQAMSVDQMRFERGRFTRERMPGTFDDYWDRSGSDAMIRAYLFPEFGVRQDPSWARAFTPQVTPALDAIRAYARRLQLTPGAYRT